MQDPMSHDAFARGADSVGSAFIKTAKMLNH
jgi:hypothetical protein